MTDSTQQYDILVAGAGFAGALTALALNSCGFKVCLLEKGKHPRFAIGESSTPAADMILRELSTKYKLPWLYDFSRYGSWQKAHPEIVSGLKRGFSFFKHYPETSFFTDADHLNELLVAASINDEQSDTQWLREDVDAFFVQKVQEAGISYFDLAEIKTLQRKGNRWYCFFERDGKQSEIGAMFLIDGSGGGQLLQKFLGVNSSSEQLLTNSFAVFSHFNHLPGWTGLMEKKNIATGDFPYDPDDSTIHHILHEGWVWVIRFNNDRTSWGFALNGEEKAMQNLSAAELWDCMLGKYPDLRYFISGGSLAPVPGALIRTGRLQRRAEYACGDGWLALPHTVGFVDPLFSTGIAYSLSGIEMIVDLLQQNKDFGTGLYQGLQNYQTKIFEELKLIDMLVSGCYKSMPHFPLFNAWSMLYFTFAIMYEQRRLSHQAAGFFLCADDLRVKEIIHSTYRDLQEIISLKNIVQEDFTRFRELVKERIRPFNTAGLLDPAAKNMYRHTAAVL